MLCNSTGGAGYGLLKKLHFVLLQLADSPLLQFRKLPHCYLLVCFLSSLLPSSSSIWTPVWNFLLSLAKSCLTLLQPCGPQSTRLLCLWDSPGKNTGESTHSLLRGSSRSRDWTWVSRIAGRFLTVWATREALSSYIPCTLPLSYFLSHLSVPHPEQLL